MIPRYLPALDFGTAASLLAGPRSASRDGIDFAPDAGAWHARGFDRARDGLAAWLRELGSARGNRVLVSAQICPAVRHAITAAGFTPAFVDIDTAYPTPAAEQFAAQLDSTIAAVLVAPFYGYLQDGWDRLLASIGTTPLCLDMAQGLLLESGLASLIGRADAVLYSFSIGKGLDLGGGVLFTRHALAAAPLPPPGVLRTGAMMSGIGLRAVTTLGLYRAVLPYVERAVDEDQQPEELPVSPGYDVSAHARIWAERAEMFAVEVAAARHRAQRIAALPAVGAACRDVEVFASQAATHLRQVIRLRSGEKRAAVIDRLRRGGVDCAPAGEPLPPAAEPQQFPNARQFTSDAIRLPFLGRLTAAQQSHVEHALEAALV